ncbi:hypothetical protein [Frigoriglobus tundricola]|uniref:Uncharacterized protein n=1 Tax=Frigoriglobus tundricola TaxID=2774151 RepID=A0A6M5YG31_9BACT|nr:hypothetical protein [Frigoriglobus tundricola]QJW92938.1 hypothetical protein FTUN_0436 [Frigoriglobus tundricola]
MFEVYAQVQAECARPVYVVRHREHRKGARWRTVATVPTRREALALVNGPGDWHIGETELTDSTTEGAEC